MEAFTQHLQKLTKTFLKSDPSSLPEILCIFLGGSRLYKQREYLIHGSDSKQSDYDSIVVVSNKEAIYSLLNDELRRQAFAHLVGIEQEESVDFKVPHPTSPLWSEFDGVSFRGYSVRGDEISLKILNLVDIYRTETINLLTFRDRRIFEAVGPERKQWVCFQTTILPEQLMVQHGQWVYATAPNNLKYPRVTFGYIADLLLTSTCIYDKDKYNYNIKKAVAKLYFSKSGTRPTPQSFCRHPLFHPTYTNWLNQGLTDLFAPFEANTILSNPETGVRQYLVFLGEIYSTQTVIELGSTSSPDKRISDETLRQFNDGQITRIKETSIPPSNSTLYKARTDNGVEILVKETLSAKDDECRAELAARYFSRVTLPRIAAKGELVYPLFRGTTKSDLRLSYIRSGYEDREIAQRILHAEMVQAEDTLRAYRLSLSFTGGSAHNADALPESNIQRYFYDRIVDDSWMYRHYGQGMKLSGPEHSIPFDKLLTMPWRINEQSYGSLQEAFDYARSVVTPESPYLHACPTVFGLGNGHGGNVLLSDMFQAKGGAGEILFTDFEVAGLHPIMLDLAKPLYADTMLESLSRKTLGDGFESETKCHVARGEIIVHLARRADTLTQAVLRIKIQYLLKPLCVEVKRLGGNLEDHVPLLAVALFLCATVSQNFSDDRIAFVENFALGLRFLRARNWDDFDALFQGC